MNWKLLLLLFSVVVIHAPARAGDTTLYVSPRGSGNGSRLSPASLQRAVAMLPELKKMNGKGAITIVLRNGTYELNEPICITPQNGGTKTLKIIFKADLNAHPVISGGKKVLIKGKGVLSANISALLKDGVPQDIYINGKRAIRARTPNTGFLKFAKVSEKKPSGIPWNKTTSVQCFEIPMATYKELKTLSSRQLRNVRFNIYHKWTTTSRTIDSLSKTKPAFYSTGPAWAPYNLINDKSIFFLENDPNALDMKNEWVLDGNDVIKYIPLDSSRRKVEAIVPVVEKLLIVKGDSDHNVYNVYFKGISFCFANKPFTGFDDSQAAASIDAAIMVDEAQNIHFRNCRVMHTGQYAVWFRKNVRHCSMKKCYIDDLGAGGVRIGETSLPEDTASFTADIKIEDCIIHSGGYDYPPAVGVFIAHSANNIVAHNDIADFRYTGVSVGWVWGYSYSPSVNNKIVYNHIHHIGWGVLSDMAGVYTLGVSPGTEVNYNVINDIYSYDYGGWGLYTDEGSSDIRMENNLVYHTKTGGFHQHYGKNNHINNNILAFGREYLAQDSRIENHLSFEFKHNILLSDGETFFQGCWKNGRVDIDSNCYWSIAHGKSLFMISTMEYGGSPVDTLSFKQWQKDSGRDPHSLFAKPGFEDPTAYNFHVKNLNIMRQIGFVPFDYRKAGVTGDEQWRKLAILPDAIIQKFDKSVREIMLD
jgi:hypothetical protein